MVADALQAGALVRRAQAGHAARSLRPVVPSLRRLVKRAQCDEAAHAVADQDELARAGLALQKLRQERAIGRDAPSGVVSDVRRAGAERVLHPLDEARVLLVPPAPLV